MRPIHPFVVGHVIAAAMVGVAAGAVLSALAVFVSATGMAIGALISCSICWALLGLEARARFLWPIAVLANPVMPTALALIVADWECLAGEGGGWECMGVAVAVVVAGLCLLPPLGGLLWRRWKRQGMI
jgi:hypothetical protein